MSAYKGQSGHRADIVVSPSLTPPYMHTIEQLTLCFLFSARSSAPHAPREVLLSAGVWRGRGCGKIQ